MNTTPENSPAPPWPWREQVILVLGLLAAWLAAGSLGWLAPPLQKTLTWLAFAAIVIAALSGRGRIRIMDVLLLGGATSIAALMTASTSPVVNILAVAILLAAVAQLRPGLTAAVAGPAALAAVALALFRLLGDSSAAAWSFTNAVGRVEGLWAGWLTGRPLLIGASFGGVDFLVLMAALAAACLVAAPPPRFGRAAWAVLWIVLAQTAYLVILAFNHDLSALLPPQVVAKQDDMSHLGLWTWGNALRALLPWNLPVLAAVFHSAAAVAIFHRTFGKRAAADLQGDAGDSLPSPSGRGAGGEGKRRQRSPQGGPTNGRPGNLPAFWVAPAALLILATVAMTLTPVKPDLKGRRIVAYDDGTIDWSTTDAGAAPPGRLPGYGLLPALVESLGGEFRRSRDLADLRPTDLLIVLPPQASAGAASPKPSMPDDLRDQVWAYVSAGGRMIVAGEPETNLEIEENVQNALLAPSAMSFRDDTVNSLTERWEDNLQSAPHAATASSDPGRSPFSVDRAASIRVSWPAGPLLVGRWAWDELGTDADRLDALPYSPGNRLGDLVLAAQQHVGKGTVVVLDAACLSNDGIPFSYTFTGPLLSALAANDATPLAVWRQLLGAAAAAAGLGLLFFRLEPLQAGRYGAQAGRLDYALPVAVASLVLALTVMICHRLSDASSGLLPAGNKAAFKPVIYVDGSHLEAMGKDPWGENGIGRLMRVLADNGYLPLVAPDLAPQRLNPAAMLISIAPARVFRSDECAAVHDFVEQGGFFLSMVGAPDAEPSRPLLDRLKLHVDPTPLPPSVRKRETEWLGRFRYPEGKKEQAEVEFYAAWPVSSAPGGETWPKDNPSGPVIAGNPIGKGQAFILGDSAFALKKNFDTFPRNATFWRNMLVNWLGHPAEKSARPAEK
jgi:hypothetical protein